MEMSPDECAAKIGELLDHYPGVTVKTAVHNADDCKTYIAMSISSIQSLARNVQICGVGVNVCVEVLPSGHRLHGGVPFDESTLTYKVVIADDDGRGSFANPPSPIHILGVFLARDQKQLGLVAASDADELQRIWHGVEM